MLILFSLLIRFGKETFDNKRRLRSIFTSCVTILNRPCTHHLSNYFCIYPIFPIYRVFTYCVSTRDNLYQCFSNTTIVWDFLSQIQYQKHYKERKIEQRKKKNKQTSRSYMFAKISPDVGIPHIISGTAVNYITSVCLCDIGMYNILQNCLVSQLQQRQLINPKIKLQPTWACVYATDWLSTTNFLLQCNWAVCLTSIT